MYSILLVERESAAQKRHESALRAHGYRLIQASTAADCREMLRWHPVDLAVLDTALPDGGVALCRELKARYHFPILLISNRAESRYVVEGLRAGADDYLVTPCDTEVLVARVEAQLRQEENRSRYICYGGLKLDTLSGCGYLDGHDLLLTQKEFTLLLLLARRAEAVVSTQEVLREIWSGGSVSDSRALWTLISRLRRKLKSESSHLEISSKRGAGYALEQI